MKQLSPDQLRLISHRRLYEIFRILRSIVSSIYSHAGPRCCEICNEYIGDDWEGDVVEAARPYEAYLQQLKKELHRRPYVDYSRRAQRKQRQERLAGLKGNRNRLRNRHHHKPAG